MFQFPRLASAAYGFSRGRLGITPAGFPHSGIPGSLPACGSPRLIAACHALHRFPAPRHPPFALSSLTTFVAVSMENIAWLHSSYSVFGCQRSARVALAVVCGSCRMRLRARSRLVEMTGFEPATPCLQSRCSPR